MEVFKNKLNIVAIAMERVFFHTNMNRHVIPEDIT